jgi:hypothetical protein
MDDKREQARSAIQEMALQEQTELTQKERDSIVYFLELTATRKVLAGFQEQLDYKRQQLAQKDLANDLSEAAKLQGEIRQLDMVISELLDYMNDGGQENNDG